jgi:pimeloyl-ACP methyl ester carboxylesterase
VNILRPALVVLLVLAVLLALVWLGQRRLIYLADRSQVPSVTAHFPDGEDVRLATSDGLTLGAWYVPPAGPDRAQTVLYAPGNGGNRAGRAPLAEVLSEAGFAVLLFDYRGYGGNPGSPTERGLARDVRAAYDYLVKDQGVRADELIYFGESLGAGVVTELATEHPPAGLVLRSPFVDLASAGAEHYPFLPVRALLWDRFPVAEQLAKVDVPTAVIYGSRDSIVPPAQSREVAQRAAGPVQLTEIAGANHNDEVLFTGPELVSAVVALASSL